VWTVACTIVALVAGRQFTAAPRAQGAGTIWDGIYSAAQADKGRMLYSDQCAVCHGDMAEGGPNAPALAGNDFMVDFNGSAMSELFNRIAQTMPANDPGSLKPADTAAIIAFVGRVNMWPAGQKDLPSDADALKNIKITKK
jgi:cytochrome c